VLALFSTNTDSVGVISYCTKFDVPRRSTLSCSDVRY